MSTSTDARSSDSDPKADQQFLPLYSPILARNAGIGVVLDYWKQVCITKDKKLRSQGYYEGPRRAALMKRLRPVPYPESVEWVDWQKLNPATGHFFRPKPAG